MPIDSRMLPPHIQKQILRKIAEQDAQRAKSLQKKQIYSDAPTEEEAKPSKYHNIKDSRGEIKFDSKHEAERFDELMLLLKAGQIRDLKLQHNITIVEGFTSIDGERIHPMVYKADFTYYDSNGKWIVEDAKGKRTRTYLDKKKLLKERKNIDIQEV